MAKKIEVFQTEYEFLKRSHEESTLALGTLAAERDRWKQAFNELVKEYGRLAHQHGECCGCTHLSDQQISFERDLCKEADYDCVACTENCPCCTCVNGSNYEYINRPKED